MCFKLYSSFKGYGDLSNLAHIRSQISGGLSGTSRELADNSYRVPNRIISQFASRMLCPDRVFSRHNRYSSLHWFPKVTSFVTAEYQIWTSDANPIPREECEAGGGGGEGGLGGGG
ncbi:hypothetical protein PoB_002436000 [Plakobranchus ocellatus]|uniref:Uncharacterized protein n=1 Tax=Plakobranchus ocellatus TaxID=259542 RepID=A0AAV3ZTB1_9GAST|nr:hypothetical protein PoB_002436000 [Plakobranchus ocellatus]